MSYEQHRSCTIPCPTWEAKIKDLESRLHDALERDRKGDEIILTLTSERDSLSRRLQGALDELRTCYRDDGCTKQEIEDQLSRFAVETSLPRTFNELVEYNKRSVVEDGCGGRWLKCDRSDCDLHVCRPGKAQCNHEQCPHESNWPAVYE